MPHPRPRAVGQHVQEPGVGRALQQRRHTAHALPDDELELLRVERYFARSRYLPSRGSTRTRWPSLMKSGTCTVTPFESLAGFVLDVFVALSITGDVSTTSSSFIVGRSIARGRSFYH